MVPYEDETLYAFELGIKNTFFDGRARFNAAVFYYDYSDFQTFNWLGIGGAISNSEASSYGGEIEITATPVDNLNVSLGVALLDSEVEDVDNGTITRDVDMSFAPAFDINGLVSYSWPVWNGELEVQGNFNYIDNRFNGQGLKEKVRPTRVFHAPWNRELPWTGMNDFFLMNNTWAILIQALRNRWLMRRCAGPVVKHRVEVNDSDEMAHRLKQKAKELGAGIVGITRIEPNDLYEDMELKYQYAICIGIPMRREEMQHVPHGRAGLEVQRVYGEVARVSIELAEHIRAMGWPAHAYGDPRSTDLLQIPLAIRAGLGQLGKHGSMISEEYGSNFRLSSVATDMPLTLVGAGARSETVANAVGQTQ